MRAGHATGASDEFLREHTLDRWSEAVSSVVYAALKLPTIAPGPVLVAGHSEGSRTAFRVAARNARVTHVAGLAGFTTSHLRCFMMGDSSWGESEFEAFDDPQDRIDAAVRKWREILAERDQYQKMFAGHSYRYWASNNTHTTLEFAVASEAEIYLAQGTADGECAVEGFQLLHAQLVERGRNVVAERVEGADHGFAFRGQPDRNGWKEQMSRMLTWFFDAAR